MEVHQTVRLLKENRNVSPGPIHDVVRRRNDRYKWTLKGNPQIPIYEQPLDASERKLLERWKVEAQIWQSGTGLQRDMNDVNNINQNWRDKWFSITQNEVWGFEEGDNFDRSLIRVVYDNVQVFPAAEIPL